MTIQEQRIFTIPQCIGMTVNQYLFAVGATKTELASRLGIALTNVSRRIRGLGDWSAEDLLITAEFLDIQVSDLLPTRDENGNWVPAPYKPGYAKSPASARDFNESRLRESNPRPSHYE